MALAPTAARIVAREIAKPGVASLYGYRHHECPLVESCVLFGRNHETMALVLVPRNSVTPARALVANRALPLAVWTVALACFEVVVLDAALVVVVFVVVFLVVVLTLHLVPDFV